MSWLLHWLGLEPEASVGRIVESSWVAAREVSPVLFWLLIGLGVLLAAVNFLPRLGMRNSVRVWTFVLRLGMVGVLALLLLGVEWQVVLDLNEPQRWLVLVDDSASMATEEDGQSRFARAKADMEQIRSRVGDDVVVEVSSFSGQPLGDEPGQGPTAFATILRERVLSRERVDRVILLTDGRDSEARALQSIGSELAATGAVLDVRVYGTDLAPADTGITAEPERSVIRLGEELLVTASIVGGSASEQQVVLKEDGKSVKTVAIPPERRGHFTIDYTPKTKGRHTYTVEVGGSDAFGGNNATHFTVDVVEERINVLLIEGSPRFEFKLMKTVLEVDPLVDLVSIAHVPGGGVYVQGEPLHRNAEAGLIESQADLFKYDVIVLRDVSRSYYRAGGDSSESRLKNIVEFVTKRGGGLIVTGGQDVYRAGGYENSHLAPILPFDLSDSIGPEAQFKGLFYASVAPAAYEHPLLRLLPVPAENRERLNSLRQLDGSNNVGRFKPMATPLMSRTVTITETDGSTHQEESPILAYMAVGSGKVIGSAVDTSWRWQLQAEFDDPPLTAMMANMIRYVAPPPSRKPGLPNVAIAGGSAQVGQELVLVTELRDKNFDPIREAELEVTVTRPDGSTRRYLPRDLPEEPGFYEYRVMVDQPGPWSVLAKYEKFESQKQFLAGLSAGEFADLSADRPAMKDLAKVTDGDVIADLPTWLGKVDMSPASRRASRDLEVWNSWLVLLIFIALVSADAFIRKRQGLA